MRIHQVLSTKVLLYRAGQFPVHRLRYDSYLGRISDAFGFERTDLQTDIKDPNNPLSVVFRNGRLGETLVPQIELLNRKLTVNVAGGSEEAESVVQTLQERLQEALEGHDLDLVIETDQSSVISQLNIDFASLQSPVFQSLAQKIGEQDEYVAEVVPSEVTCRVYFDTDEKLRREQITVSPKNVTLRRHGDSPDDFGTFESHMPTTSAYHIRLLEELEGRSTSG